MDLISVNSNFNTFSFQNTKYTIVYVLTASWLGALLLEHVRKGLHRVSNSSSKIVNQLDRNN